MSTGLSANIEFLELTYLDRNDVSRGKAFQAIAPLLWLKAGGTGLQVSEVTQPFALLPGAHYGILFDLAAWRAFVEALAERTDITYAFIVTDSLAQYQQVAADLPSTVEGVMLYEDYLTNFEVNIGGVL